jgi:hypothetical protein
MRYLVLAAALAVGSAIAGQEMVFTGDGLTVRLTLAPCEHPALVAGLTAAGTQTPPRAAWIKSGNIEVGGCWGTLEEKVLIGDEAGNGGYIPMAAFKPSSGI